MSNSYEVKIRPEHFQEVWEGRRHHYAGSDQTHIEINDVLMLQEYNPDQDEITERRMQVTVTSITRAPFVPIGWFVLSFQHMNVEGKLCCNMRRDRFGDDAPDLSGYAHQSSKK